MKSVVIFLMGMVAGWAFIPHLASGQQSDRDLRCDMFVQSLHKYTSTMTEMVGFIFGRAMTISGIPEKRRNQILKKCSDKKLQQLAKREYEPTLELHLKKVLQFCGCSG